MRKTLLILHVVILCGCLSVFGQRSLRVDMNAAKKHITSSPLGINLFMLMDHDKAQYRAVPMYKALQNLGVRSVRFNEGEYGDWYLFTHPDSLHLLTRADAPLYPLLIDIKSKGLDSKLTDISVKPQRGGYPLNREGYRRTVDFNDFIQMCRKAGVTDPTIIIPTHPLNWKDAPDYYPSQEEMVGMAAAMVRYANKVCASGYKYWEIGNEHYWENKNDARDTVFARECAAFDLRIAMAMKQVDSTILVGVNGFTDEWLETLLAYEDQRGRLIDYIDYIIPHQYAKPELVGTYEKYLNSGRYGLHEVDEVVAVLSKTGMPDQQKRDRLTIEVTETSGFMAGSPALKVANCAWVSLLNFEHLGYVINAPKVGFAHFWATHWTDDEIYWSALKMDNRIAPMGWGVKLWNDYLLDSVWAADLHDNTVRCYASSSADNSSLTLFVVNKSTDPQPCTITIEGAVKSGKGWLRELWAEDTEAADFNFSKAKSAALSGGQFVKELKPLSITIVRFDRLK